jgi:hypothetical protein
LVILNGEKSDKGEGTMRKIRFIFLVMLLGVPWIMSTLYAEDIFSEHNPHKRDPINKSFFGATIQQEFLKSEKVMNRLIELYQEANIGSFRWVHCPCFKWSVWKKKHGEPGFWDAFRTFALKAKEASIEGMPTLGLKPHPRSYEDRRVFRDYLKDFLKHSKQYGIKSFQVGNEPPGRFFEGDADEYAELLAETYKIAKETYPECKVVMAGWAAGMGNRSVKFLQTFFQKYGSDRMFDVFDFHINYQFYPTGYRQFMNRGYKRSQWFFKRYPAYANTRLIVSEIGVPGGPVTIYRDSLRKIKAMPRDFMADAEFFTLTDENQANEVAKRLVLAISLGIARVSWNTFVDKIINIPDKPVRYIRSRTTVKSGRDPSAFTSMDTRGLVRSDYTKRISFTTFKVCSEWLIGSKYVGKAEARPKEVYGYEFTKNGRVFYVFWVDPTGGLSIERDMKFPIVTKQVKLIDIYTGAMEIIDVENNTFYYHLTEKPIFVVPVN